MCGLPGTAQTAVWATFGPNYFELLRTVRFQMLSRGVFRVIGGMEMVRMCHVGVMRGLLVVAGLMLL